MNVLELFCGTKSIGKEFEKVGAKVVSLDFEERFEPTICTDILTVDTEELLFHAKPDVIWASPPCNGFSVAVIGRNWTVDHQPKTDSARLGLAILEKTVEILKTAERMYPNIQWWFENPRGKMRKMPIVQQFNVPNKKGELVPPNTVSYCRYGDTRMKPTDIWSNTAWVGRGCCLNGSGCHDAAPRGSRTGTQGIKGAKDRAVIPAEFCREIAEYALLRINRPEQRRLPESHQPSLFDLRA